MGAEQSNDRLCGACSEGEAFGEYTACVKRAGADAPNSREGADQPIVDPAVPRVMGARKVLAVFLTREVTNA